MKRLLTAVLFALTLTPPQAWCGAAEPVSARACLATLAATPVTVDGRLAEPVWQAAPATGAFTLLGGRGEALAQTVVRVAYDAAALYVAIEAGEPCPGGLVTNCKSRDGAVWMDDSLEVFVSSALTGKPYFQFVTNSASVLFDSQDGNYGWNGEWTAAAQVQGKSWIAEFAIPWRTLAVPPPQSGDAWRLNVCRERQAAPRTPGKVAELSSWSPCLAQFHEPEHYGYVLFADRTGTGPALGQIERLAAASADAGITLSLRAGEVRFASYSAQARQELQAARASLELSRQRLARTVVPTFAQPRLKRLEAARQRLEALAAQVATTPSFAVPQLLAVREEVRTLGADAEHLLWEARFAELLEGEQP